MFYENEWETPLLDETKEFTTWIDPGKKVVQSHIDASNKFQIQTKKIELKLAFAAGLKESIKRQELFQETKSVVLMYFSGPKGSTICHFS